MQAAASVASALEIYEEVQILSVSLIPNPVHPLTRPNRVVSPIHGSVVFYTVAVAAAPCYLFAAISHAYLARCHLDHRPFPHIAHRIHGTFRHDRKIRGQVPKVTKCLKCDANGILNIGTIRWV